MKRCMRTIALEVNMFGDAVSLKCTVNAYFYIYPNGRTDPDGRTVYLSWPWRAFAFVSCQHRKCALDARQAAPMPVPGQYYTFADHSARP